MTYKASKRKLLFEQVAMWPFVLLGKLAGYLFPLKTDHKAFLFFPNADIGGSPKVNADIANLLKYDNPLIIFSKKAHNNQYRERYEKTGIRILDLHPYIDNKLIHFVNIFFRGLLSAWINKQKDTVVFGGEAIYFYKVIPHLRKDIRCVELTHVDVWLPYTIGFTDRINARVFSTRKGLEKTEQQYRDNQFSEEYFERLFFINNAIDIPSVSNNNNDQLEIFFIGRGSVQKRIHLVAAAAKALHEERLPVHFNFVGDVEKMIDPQQYPFCQFYGSVNDENEMSLIYQKADVLLLTSSFEGLPIVIMQMMAYGNVVISTAVNGIPDYIFHNQNGLLIAATEEVLIVEEAISHIRHLITQPQLKASLGFQARKDALAQFSKEAFNKNYRNILCI